MRILSLILAGAGIVLIVITAVRFHKLICYTREESYHPHLHNNRMNRLMQAMLALFILGFFIGIADIFMREVEPIYLFVVCIFFFGSLFITIAVDVQIKMAVLLREKTMEMMRTFVNAIEMKDKYTSGHSQQVYTVVGLFYEQLSETMQRKISRPKLMDAAMLHDIGKISVPDDVLNKKERLNEEDWQKIKTHPEKGKRILDDTSFRDISDWVYMHHERMDGRGYYKISPEKIPLEARIITIADTYCALCTDRVYRPHRQHDEAIAIMHEVAGSQLDPDLFDRFMRIPKKELQQVIG